jgi:flagellar protein FlaG
VSSNMSISNSGMLPISPPTDVSPKTAESSSSEQQSISNTAEMRQAEKQGVKLSISDEQLIKAIDRAIKALQGPTTECDISIHEKTKQLVIKVIDKENGKVLREIPPEKTLDMVAKMMEIAGILIDERV